MNEEFLYQRVMMNIQDVCLLSCHKAENYLHFRASIIWHLVDNIHVWSPKTLSWQHFNYICYIVIYYDEFSFNGFEKNVVIKHWFNHRLKDMPGYGFVDAGQNDSTLLSDWGEV